MRGSMVCRCRRDNVEYTAKQSNALGSDVRMRNIPQKSTKPRCGEDGMVGAGRVELVGPAAQSTSAVRLCTVSIAYLTVNKLSEYMRRNRGVRASRCKSDKWSTFNLFPLGFLGAGRG